jgi:anti-sigma factor RsiW
MTVTRDVIYDLLPAYFSGDASADTRALVERFLATDPELKQMADRFAKLMSNTGRTSSADADRDKVAFVRARSRVKLRMAGLAWALGAMFGFVMVFLVPGHRSGFGHPGFIIGIVFMASAIAMWLMSLSSRPERLYAAFTGNEKDAGR